MMTQTGFTGENNERNLDVSRALVFDCILPILGRCRGRLLQRVAVALIGEGSDVLGCDDAFSRDHHCYPRFIVFVDDSMSSEERGMLRRTLRGAIPATYRNVILEDPDSTFTITTVSTFAQRYLGLSLAPPLGDREWLRVPQQRLLEFTRGEVFHDPVGELTRWRSAMAWYPLDVWLFCLGYAWTALGQDGCALGRIGARGYAISMHIAWCRFAEQALRLSLLLARRYCPASVKWMHRELAASGHHGVELETSLASGFAAADFREKTQWVEASYRTLYCQTTEVVSDIGGERHVRLPPMERDYHFLGEIPLNHKAVGRAFRDAVCGELRHMVVDGAPDQWVTNRELIRDPQAYRRLHDTQVSADPIQVQLVPPRVSAGAGTSEWAEQLHSRSTGDPWGQDWRAMQRIRHRQALPILQRHTGDDVGQVLEIGCSHGAFTRLLSRQYSSARLVVVDPSKLALAKVREDLPAVETLQGTFPELSLAGQFDLIVTLEVLGFVARADWPDAMRKLHTLLAPEGVLLLGLNRKWLAGDDDGDFSSIAAPYLKVRWQGRLQLGAVAEGEWNIRNGADWAHRWARDLGLPGSHPLYRLVLEAVAALSDETLVEQLLAFSPEVDSHELLVLQRGRA